MAQVLKQKLPADVVDHCISPFLGPPEAAIRENFKEVLAELQAGGGLQNKKGLWWTVVFPLTSVTARADLISRVDTWLPGDVSRLLAQNADLATDMELYEERLRRAYDARHLYKDETPLEANFHEVVDQWIEDVEPDEEDDDDANLDWHPIRFEAHCLGYALGVNVDGTQFCRQLVDCRAGFGVKMYYVTKNRIQIAEPGNRNRYKVVRSTLEGDFNCLPLYFGRSPPYKKLLPFELNEIQI